MKMKCPKCKNAMIVIKSDISNNQKDGDDYREYKRTIFHCQDDDIWMNLEIPQKSL